VTARKLWLMLAFVLISEAGALQQKRDESMTERVVRGVNHCRTALLAGYTTYRSVLLIHKLYLNEDKYTDLFCLLQGPGLGRNEGLRC
jgi:hypothetical protein